MARINCSTGRTGLSGPVFKTLSFISTFFVSNEQENVMNPKRFRASLHQSLHPKRLNIRRKKKGGGGGGHQLFIKAFDNEKNIILRRNGYDFAKKVTLCVLCFAMHGE